VQSRRLCREKADSRSDLRRIEKLACLREAVPSSKELQDGQRRQEPQNGSVRQRKRLAKPEGKAAVEEGKRLSVRRDSDWDGALIALSLDLLRRIVLALKTEPSSTRVAARFDVSASFVRELRT
jgi:hypothetical protein